ncbi:SUKH-3 immunity protein of toxin-antitoxin system [Streptomyces sp. Amel2xB2]|uniref:SUKH-3 domain-containing protein n=1 Tax=Streptomyces sp. Amel2xB2 TaxID=1305829 RepID=UPI000DB956DA|nr:SUKH-3 domain-containing protein [Streptomyces sp. Amel2xB2]RAJ61780.1 SUKH-3 immunity protein of toxin-antitoxin system [Streptomyces sp. Amel2xB2]
MSTSGPLPPHVAEVLSEAGWTESWRADTSRWRDAFVDDGVDAHPAALEFLEKFGGLSVNISGPGITCARTPFAFDPALCDGEGDRFADWSTELGVHLFPIGELDNGHFFLGIDEHGVIYLVADWIARFGTWPEALDALVRGIQPETVVE